MRKEDLIEYAKFLDADCDLLGADYIESMTNHWIEKNPNKNFVLADVSGRNKLLRSFIGFVLSNNYIIKESTVDDIISEFERNCH